jgi:hypothetical protein
MSNSMDRSRSLSPSSSSRSSSINPILSNLPDQMDDESSSSSSELIRGYRMDRLRNQTIQERKDKLLKNVTQHCNEAIRYSGDLTTNYPKSSIDGDLQEWLPKELSERGVDSYYTPDGYFLKMYLDDAFLQPEYESDQDNDSLSDQENESDQENDFLSESDQENDDQKPSYNNQLILLLFVLVFAIVYYIKVCYMNNTATSSGCKGVEQYFNRTAQQFISNTAATTEENTDLWG